MKCPICGKEAMSEPQSIEGWRERFVQAFGGDIILRQYHKEATRDIDGELKAFIASELARARVESAQDIHQMLLDCLLDKPDGSNTFEGGYKSALRKVQSALAKIEEGNK